MNKVSDCPEKINSVGLFVKLKKKFEIPLFIFKNLKTNYVISGCIKTFKDLKFSKASV